MDLSADVNSLDSHSFGSWWLCDMIEFVFLCLLQSVLCAFWLFSLACFLKKEMKFQSTPAVVSVDASISISVALQSCSLGKAARQLFLSTDSSNCDSGVWHLWQIGNGSFFSSLNTPDLMTPGFTWLAWEFPSPYSTFLLDSHIFLTVPFLPFTLFPFSAGFVCRNVLVWCLESHWIW